MSRERIDSDEVPLTQEFVATMLGVSRPIVSLKRMRYSAAASRIMTVRGTLCLPLRPGFGFQPIAQPIRLAQSNWESFQPSRVKTFRRSAALLIGHCFERVTEK
jgi:hypothetical protein